MVNIIKIKVIIKRVFLLLLNHLKSLEKVVMIMNIINIPKSISKIIAEEFRIL